MNQGIRTFDTLLAVGAVLIAFFLLGPLLTIPLHVPLTYNEGWNAYLAQRAAGLDAGPLYPGADTLVFNNYPPLSFYLVGAFGRYVVGDMIVAGRIVAATSLLLSAVLVGVCVRRLGGGRRGSLAASCLLLLYASTFFRDYVAMDDPQWLAHVLMLGGLTVLLQGRADGRYPWPRVVIAALLVTAGGFVKHSLVGLPLAITIWLVVVRPQAAMVWMLAAVGGVAAGLATTELLHGHAAFADILEHQRVFRARRMVKAVERLLPLLPMMLIAGLAYRRRMAGDRSMLFLTLFLVISLLTGILERLGEGVNYNAYFETMIALCLTTGLVVSRAFAAVLPFRRATLGPAALVGLAAVPLLVMMPWHLTRALGDISDRAARARSWQPVIARIATSPGTAGCETLAACFWARKPFAVDLFNLNQSILTGGSIMRFDRMARTHAFGVFQYGAASFIHKDAAGTLTRERPLLELLEHGYAPAGTWGGGNVLLEPPGTVRQGS